MDSNIQSVVNVLNVLKSASKTSMLAYWVTPNTILTLSGVRAFCDGVFWSQDKKLLETWNRDIAISLQIIKSHSVLVFVSSGIQEVRDGEMYASYELVLEDGLRSVLSHTGLISSDAFNQIKSASTMPGISAQMTSLLGSRAEFKKYTKEDLEHIAFGILVGYPDEAIKESVKAWQEDDPFTESLIDADIRGASYYVCPQPVYSYPRHLVTNQKIIAHEKTWSRILKDYYTSPFHQALETDPEFQQKMKELGNLR